MRTLALLVAILTSACGAGASQEGDGPSRRTSEASFGTGRSETSPIIGIEAGRVTLRHTVPSVARLRATTLEGVDPHNRFVTYSWERDGSYEVEVSGRYRHSVMGSIIGSGVQHVRSILTYTPLPEG